MALSPPISRLGSYARPGRAPTPPHGAPTAAILAGMSIERTSTGHARVEPRGGGGIAHAAAKWGRIGIAVVAVAVQLGVLIAAVTYLRDFSSWVLLAQELVAVVVVLFILNSSVHTVYKLAWIIPILIAPVLGSAFFLLYGGHGITRRRAARHRAIMERAERGLDLVPTDAADHPAARGVERQWRYLQTASPWRLYDGTATSYYPVGELAFEDMLADCERAERYIFCEFFIVAQGRMFERLFDVLARRAGAGVDVRFLYDDVGSLLRVPARIRQRCEEAGIHLRAVNPLRLGMTLRLNNRDHRKLLIVDGTVGWTGGINIGDEYVNLDHRLGHWKDTQIRLEGPGAWGMTVLYLYLWEHLSNEEFDYADYLPDAFPRCTDTEALGVVLPFDDSPFDSVSVGAQAYRHMMAGARDSVDIITPYLIVEDLMMDDLVATVKSGVRVRIITPGVPDKKIVYEVTCANYLPLLEAGVEIYEYTPGFVHAKHMVVDGEVAMVGTINFDYRSFYLHQEDSVWMAGVPILKALADDYEATLAVCERVTLERELSLPWWRRWLRGILNTFAPFM